MNQLKNLLEKEQLTHIEVKQRYGISRTTLHSWCSDSPPRNVSRLVAMLIDIFNEKEKDIGTNKKKQKITTASRRTDSKRDSSKRKRSGFGSSSGASSRASKRGR